MNSDLMRFIALARTAWLLEPVLTENHLNSSTISGMEIVGPRELFKSLGDEMELYSLIMVEERGKKMKGV
jgi:hypothetical protein